MWRASGRRRPTHPTHLQGATKALCWTLENLTRPGDEIRLVHVIPVPTPEVIGGVGVGGAGDFLVQPPDPRVDRANGDRAEKFLAERCVPRLEEAKAFLRAAGLAVPQGDSEGGEGSDASSDASSGGSQGIVEAKHREGTGALERARVKARSKKHKKHKRRQRRSEERE